MQTSGTKVFGYHVSDPKRYGLVDFDEDGTVRSNIEKPEVPPSNYAMKGLYFVDGNDPERAKSVEPSARGELEITTLLYFLLTRRESASWQICVVGYRYPTPLC